MKRNFNNLGEEMRKYSVMVLILTAMMSAASAGAMQNIRFGGAIDINPTVSVQQSYDSNIHLDNHPSSAWINRAGLGVDFVNKIGSRLDLTGGYAAEFLSYSRNSNINNATHQFVNLGAVSRLPRDMDITVDDKYMLTTDPATTVDVARASRLQNTADVGVDAPLRGKFGFNLSAQHTYHNYLTGNYDLLDRQEMLVGGEVTYKVQPKTKLLFGYRYGTMAYRLGANDFRLVSANKGDSYYNDLDLGVTGNLAPKVTGTIKAGVQFRNYLQHLNQAKNDITTGGYNVQLVWSPMTLTDVMLYGSRGNVETTYGKSRFYTSTVGDISLSREVHKIKAGLGFNYETLAFPEKSPITPTLKRLDTDTSVRLTAEYDIQKWLKADAAYTYKNRASNDRVNRYSDNICSVELKGMF